MIEVQDDGLGEVLALNNNGTDGQFLRLYNSGTLIGGLGNNSSEVSSFNIYRGSTRAISIGNATGDISFYEDTGTTAKLYWDASTERLGIGTTSPSTGLHISNTGPVVTLTDTDTSARNILSGASGNGSLLLGADEDNAVANSGISLRVDGSEKIDIGDTATVINESGADYDFQLKSSQKANMFFLDAGNNRIGVGTGVPDTTLHVTSTTSGGVLTLDKYGSNNSAGPNIVSYRSSSTPAADDNLGKILYRGTNSAAEDVDYVSVSPYYRVQLTGQSKDNMKFTLWLMGQAATV